MNNYIVPFLGIDPQEKNKTHFIGNAFIINPGILITVGHNLELKKNKIYKSYGIVFNDNLIILDRPVFCEFNNTFIDTGDNEDLAIFDMKDLIKGGFELTDYELKHKDDIEIIGYTGFSIDNGLDNEQIQNVGSSIKFSDYSLRHFSKGKNSKYVNCFQIKDILDDGFSGCPVFVHGKLCGMISYGPDKKDLRIDLPDSLNFGSTAIKMTYIKTVINKGLKE